MTDLMCTVDCARLPSETVGVKTVSLQLFWHVAAIHDRSCTELRLVGPRVSEERD